VQRVDLGSLDSLDVVPRTANVIDQLAAAALGDCASATQIARAQACGRITVPLQQTFWAQRFGAVVDRYGIPWHLNGGERKAV